MCSASECFRNRNQLLSAFLLHIEVQCDLFLKIQNGVAATMESEEKQAPNKVPIVYSKNYSVRFAGLEKLHPFDAAKGKHIQQVKTIIQNGLALWTTNSINFLASMRRTVTGMW